MCWMVRPWGVGTPPGLFYFFKQYEDGVELFIVDSNEFLPQFPDLELTYRPQSGMVRGAESIYKLSEKAILDDLAPVWKRRFYTAQTDCCGGRRFSLWTLLPPSSVSWLQCTSRQWVFPGTRVCGP